MAKLKLDLHDIYNKGDQIDKELNNIIEEAVTKIKAALRATGEREIESRSVGELVMSQLRDLDEVAFVRFASVYRSFKDLDEFRQEIDRLSGEGEKPAGE